jgi:hypothetical protein
MKWIIKQQKTSGALENVNLGDICILCEKKGPDLNLLSIPCLLPPLLLKKGDVHLNCLKNVIKKNEDYFNNMYLVIVSLMGNLTIVFGVILGVLPNHSLFNVGMVLLIGFLVMSSTMIPFLLTSFYQIQKWIKTQYPDKKNARLN